MRVVAVGATKNFFKVGQATFHYLAKSHPDIQLRLVIPDVQDAVRAVREIDIELFPWDPSDPQTLAPALSECDAMFMAPPIDERVLVVKNYLSALAGSDISYIACLGIQFTSTDCRMGVAADEVKRLLEDSGIEHDVFDLPMFLENLLYQVPSISQRGQFSFPISGSSEFAYVACDDLAPIFGERLISSTRAKLTSTSWTASAPISCDELAAIFSQTLGREVRFVRQSREQFIQDITSWGISRSAGEDIAELWDLMGSGRDIPSTSALEELMRRPSLSFAKWAETHICCFDQNEARPSCRHPLPPRDHMY